MPPGANRLTATAVLFVIFNRPDLTRRSFERIRQARPRRLFVVADGPRPSRPGEAALCEAARAAIKVDWPCDVVRDYSDVNLGCKRRISSAITSAFRSEERLIVLEDDCVADATFFPYSEELLERYADDPRVMAISGDNFEGDRPPRAHSYYFSRYPHCWGWATWRRAWASFDPDMRAWPRLKRTGWLADLLETDTARAQWARAFDMAFTGEVDSWAYPWTLACWLQGGLTALPARNLVINIGQRDDATHTTAASSSVPERAEPLELPLRHPPQVLRDERADAFTQARHFEQRAERLGERLRARAPGFLTRRLERAFGRPGPTVHTELERLAPLQHAPRHLAGVVTFRGVPLEYVDAPSFYWQLREIFVDGTYDVDLPPSPRIVDVGANVGLAAVRFREFAPDARLTSYEADPALAAVAARNLRAAGDRASEVVASAVWTHEGRIAFTRDGADGGSVSATGSEVPCVDVADLCREPVDLLKLDVEGAEAALVSRLVALDRVQNVARLVLEWHDRHGLERRLDELLAALAGAGFTYAIRRAIESSSTDPTPSGSGFRAVQSRGGLCHVYAWRVDAARSPGPSPRR